jgi:hypothetical protein
MIGKYFHSIVDGIVFWQGKVIGNPAPGWYLVQLFDWIMGTKNICRLVKLEDMKEWLFYPDSDSMKYSYEYGVAREGGPYRKKA